MLRKYPLLSLELDVFLHCPTFPVGDVVEHAREEDPVWNTVGFVPGLRPELTCDVVLVLAIVTFHTIFSDVGSTDWIQRT